VPKPFRVRPEARRARSARTRTGLTRGWNDDCLIAVAGACPRAGPWPDPWDRRDLAEARADLAAWIGKWQTKYPRLVAWVEENIEETLTFYRRRASITSL
jgi:hypothetical protein